MDVEAAFLLCVFNGLNDGCVSIASRNRRADDSLTSKYLLN